ncbi:MAG: hypothetical protein IPK62_06550 [Bacteroidetes bacterium]|nr:hypothetical protein [Bacteroidota bacterium]MBK8144675.1 hypothetical protein [Bacteroidota bacterium]MBP6315929.1 hypothetical protein [Chitinophagaceae bacterium]
MSIKINKENYEYYREVFRIICYHQWKDNPVFFQKDTDPIAVLDNWQKTSSSLARKGLQSGLNDILLSITYCSSQVMTDINADLEMHNLPKVTQLLKTVDKTIEKVLRFKKIKNEGQYYIIKELLDDTSSELTDQDKQTLSTCLMMYEEAQQPPTIP